MASLEFSWNQSKKCRWSQSSGGISAWGHAIQRLRFWGSSDIIGPSSAFSIWTWDELSLPSVGSMFRSWPTPAPAAALLCWGEKGLLTLVVMLHRPKVLNRTLCFVLRFPSMSALRVNFFLFHEWLVVSGKVVLSIGSPSRPRSILSFSRNI